MGLKKALDSFRREVYNILIKFDETSKANNSTVSKRTL